MRRVTINEITREKRWPFWSWLFCPLSRDNRDRSRERIGLVSYRPCISELRLELLVDCLSLPRTSKSRWNEWHCDDVPLKFSVVWRTFLLIQLRELCKRQITSVGWKISRYHFALFDMHRNKTRYILINFSNKKNCRKYYVSNQYWRLVSAFHDRNRVNINHTCATEARESPNRQRFLIYPKSSIEDCMALAQKSVIQLLTIQVPRACKFGTQRL